MDGALTWTEMPGGADCHRTGIFYASIFGWDVDDDGQMVRFRDPGGVLAGAFVGELAPAAAGGPILYLASDDLAATLEAAVAEGAEVVLPRTLVAPGVGYRAQLRDPAGSLIGVFEAASASGA